MLKVVAVMYVDPLCWLSTLQRCQTRLKVHWKKKKAQVLAIIVSIRTSESGTFTCHCVMVVNVTSLVPNIRLTF